MPFVPLYLSLFPRQTENHRQYDGSIQHKQWTLFGGQFFDLARFFAPSDCECICYNLMAIVHSQGISYA